MTPHQALNKEKARANGQQKAPQKTEKSNGIAPHSSPEQTARTSGPTPTVRRAGSIIGTEEDRLLRKPPPTSRPRQLSAATASSHIAPSFTRIRASSTTTDSSTAVSSTFLSKHMLSESTSALSDQRPASGSVHRKKDVDISRSSRMRSTMRQESLDLEDGSDDDSMGELKSPKQSARQRGLSANTRELIAFLAEGPPEFTHDDSLSPFSTTSKKSGRLQKMISRITLAGDTARAPRKMTIGSGDSSSKSMTNLSPLANRPVPPRYPIPVPSSAVSSERDSADQAVTHPRQRAHSYIQNPYTTYDGKYMEGDAAASPVPSLAPGTEEGPIDTISPVPATFQKRLEIDIPKQVQPIKSSPSPTPLPTPAISTSVPVRDIEAADAIPRPTVQLSPLPPAAVQRISSKTSSPLRKKVVPSPNSQTSPPALSTLEHAREMRTMLEHATSATECRILVDMFLARSKLIADVTDLRALTTIPLPRDPCANALEGAIVGLLLGDGEPDVEEKCPVVPRSEPGEPRFEAVDGPCTSLAHKAEPSDPY